MDYWVFWGLLGSLWSQTDTKIRISVSMKLRCFEEMIDQICLSLKMLVKRIQCFGGFGMWYTYANTLVRPTIW